MAREQITPAEERLVAPVYASAVILAQYPGPSTSRRYAQIPSVGFYSWSLGSAATIDGVDVVGHTGGYSGRWLRVSVDDGVVRTHEAVRAVITSGAATGLVHDGVTLTAGQRVLRAVGAEVANGIYLAAAGAHTRASDMPAAATLALGGIVPVLEGSAANVGLWSMSSPTTGSPVVGTAALGFTWQGPAVNVPSGSAQVLPDADTAIASARASRAVAITASRADTLSDGTTVGQRRTVGRTLTSVSGNVLKNRAMNSDGSVAAWLNGPGEVELAWDGTRWAPVGSDIKERILTPYDFGGRGDGSYDDAVPLQAWLDALAIVDNPCVGVLPIGDWRTTVPLRLLGGGTNAHSVRIVGRGGRSNADRGSHIYYDGAATDSALFTCVGLIGSSFDDIKFNANSLAKFAVLCHIEDGIDESSSGLIFSRCAFRKPRDIAGSAAVAFGPVVGVPGTQTDTIMLVDCKVSCTDSGWLTNADCFATLQGGNTKNFTLTRCQFEGGRRGINWALASGGMEVTSPNFASCAVDYYQGNGGSAVITCAQSERSGRAVTGPGAGGSLEIHEWEWHGGRLCADDIAISAAGGRVSVDGVTAINYRALRTITGVEALGADIFSFNGDENGVGLPTTNEIVQVRTNGGTLPAPLVAGTDYYVRDHVDLGGGLFSCKLEATIGGGAITITSAGSGSLFFVSPVKIVATGTEQLTAATQAAFTSRDSFWDCAIGQLPITDGSNILLDPSYATSNANGIPVQVESIGDRGGLPAAPVRLRNITPGITEQPRLSLGRSVLDTPYDNVGTQLFSGAPSMAWHVERFNYTELVKANTTINVYRRMPVRATVKRAIVEITQQFANAAGNVTLNLYEATAFATILTAVNLESATGTVFGELAAEHGTAWKAAIGVRPAVAWNATWSVLLNLVTTGGNWGDGTASLLTAGEFILYLEYEVPPRSGS